MTTTAAPASRFYVIAGGITVTGRHCGQDPQELDPSARIVTDDIRSVGGGWFRTRRAAAKATGALWDNGIMTAIIKAGSSAEAIAARRADERARLESIGLA